MLRDVMAISQQSSCPGWCTCAQEGQGFSHCQGQIWCGLNIAYFHRGPDVLSCHSPFAAML